MSYMCDSKQWYAMMSQNADGFFVPFPHLENCVPIPEVPAPESRLMKCLHPWPTVGFLLCLATPHEDLQPSSQCVCSSPQKIPEVFIPGFMKILHALKSNVFADIQRWGIMVMNNLNSCLVRSKPQPWSRNLILLFGNFEWSREFMELKMQFVGTKTKTKKTTVRYQIQTQIWKVDIYWNCTCSGDSGVWR